MSAGICHRDGVLYVGRGEGEARVRAFDLDGRALATDFGFRDADGGRSQVGGLSMDDDHRLWVADSAAAKLRAFTLFGQEVASVGGEPDQALDRSGSIGTPVGVLARGADAELELIVISAEVRRHALHRLWPEEGRARSLRPEGDPRGRFRRLRSLAFEDERLFVLEGGRGRVQVFQGIDHHYSLDLGLDVDSEASALAALPGGELVVAVAGPSGGLLHLSAAGGLRRVLADSGPDTGQVQHPVGLCVVPGRELLEGGPARVFLLDQDGRRVQVFSIEGSCYGAF